MKHIVFFMSIFALALGCSGGGDANRQAAEEPVLSPRGSISFWFRVESNYYNGVEPRGDLATLAEAPDVFTVTLDTPSIDAAAAQAEFGAKEQSGGAGEKKPPSSVVNLEWQWMMEGGNRLNLYLPLLPGGHWYHLAFNWDAPQGIFDGYLNGLPLRVPGTKVQPWTIREQPLNVTTGPNVADLEVTGEFLSGDAIRERLNARETFDMAPLMGYGDTPPMGNTDALKGKLLYEADFAEKGVLDEWTMEGPGEYSTDGEGWLTMWSTGIDKGGPGDGHFVFWAPGVFPEDFIAEWDFQALSDEGLCIAILSALGRNGRDVRDPSLKPRDGHFAGYIRGDINCYHISYYANIPTNPGRIVSNLRKNYGFFLVSNGPPGVPSGSKEVHRITLIKNKGRIRLGVDGNTIIDWRDDGVKYGPVLGRGSFALRQMKWMKARYNNFSIWAVK